MHFISFRRYFLDKELEKAIPLFRGTVLDVGASRVRRGSFEPPYDQVDEWLFLDNNEASKPDVLADLPTIPVDEDTVSVTLCTEVIEYIYDYQTLVAELYRVLEPGGTLILSAPLMYTVHNDHEYDYYRLTEQLLRKELTKHGFVIERFERMGGMVAVVFDLLRGYMSYQTKRTLLVRVVHKAMTVTHGFWGFLDAHLFKNNFYTTTGYFVVAQKPAH